MRRIATPTSIQQGSKFSTLIYGPNQERIVQSDSNGRETRYVGGIYEEVIKGGVTQKIHYVGDFALFIQTGSEKKYEYLHRDHIGSIVAISKGTIASANDVNWQSNGAWGERRYNQWNGPLDNMLVPTSTAKGFTDHEHLDSVGLIHMNGRVYDPELGRFMSADPFVQAPYNSQSYNRYSYVFNNPLSFTDPSGYAAEDGIKDLKISCGMNEYLGSDGYCHRVETGETSDPEKPGDRSTNNSDAYTYTGMDAYHYVQDQINSQYRSDINNLFSFGSYLPNVPRDFVNFGVGLGSAVSFGLGGWISEKVNGSTSFDRGSDEFEYGGYAGIIGGAGGLARGLATNAPKFLYNPQSFSKISREYWKNKIANGASLHHWLFPQKAKFIPEGIRNAGFNLVQLPALKGVFHPKLGLNQWMGFAQRWGGSQGKQAAIVENMIRVGIPGSIVGSAYIGYEIGQD